MDKKDMFDKIKTMDLEELCKYHGAAKFASRLMDVFGVSIFLFIMMFTSIITILPGAILLYVLGNVASGIGETIQVIEERIVRLADK